MTKYERKKLAIIKSAVEKKLSKQNYKIVCSEFLVNNYIIDYICIDSKTNELVFVMVFQKRNTDFLKEKKRKSNRVASFNVQNAIDWFKRSQHYEEYASRVDEIDIYVGTKSVRLRYYKNVSYDKDAI